MPQTFRKRADSGLALAKVWPTRAKASKSWAEVLPLALASPPYPRQLELAIPRSSSRVPSLAFIAGITSPAIARVVQGVPVPNQPCSHILTVHDAPRDGPTVTIRSPDGLATDHVIGELDVESIGGDLAAPVVPAAAMTKLTALKGVYAPQPNAFAPHFERVAVYDRHSAGQIGGA